jgi:uncharacterized protein YecE (DUF72 family)
MILIGTAGWSIPRQGAHRFAGDGSHLTRYARVFPCAEINSSFYRSHGRKTYAQWANQTPATFRFAVKIPQEISHENALRRARQPLAAFLTEAAGLGTKLGALLLQLPPSNVFEPRPVRQFFSLLRALHEGSVMCEPRHASWFGARANELMQHYRICRVAADPSPHNDSHAPGGWLGGDLYYRLHGSPRKYWSAYSPEYLNTFARRLALLPEGRTAWCVFDNTASGAAAVNALDLKCRLTEKPSPD